MEMIWYNDAYVYTYNYNTSDAESNDSNDEDRDLNPSLPQIHHFPKNPNSNPKS